MPASRPLLSNDYNAGALAQIMARLDTMDARLQNVATRDDLSKLVSLDLYQEARRSDTTRFDDMARRLGALETDVRRLGDTSHEREVREARDMTQIQGSTAAQIGQVQAAAQQGLTTATRWTSDAISKVQYALIGFLSTGFVYLLIHALIGK